MHHQVWCCWLHAVTLASTHNTVTQANLHACCQPQAALPVEREAPVSCYICLCPVQGSDSGEAVTVAPGLLEPRCEALVFVVSAAACELCACNLSAVPSLALIISSHGKPLASRSGPSPREQPCFAGILVGPFLLCACAMCNHHYESTTLHARMCT